MKFLQFFILIIKKFPVIKNDNLDNPSEMGEDLILHFLLSLFTTKKSLISDQTNSGDPKVAANKGSLVATLESGC